MGAAAAEPAVDNAESPLPSGSFVADTVAPAADLTAETCVAELPVVGRAEPVAVGAGTVGGTDEHVLVSAVGLVAGIVEDSPGFGCAASATKNLAECSVIEDPVGAVAAEPAGESDAESLLDTAGFDKVVAELAAAAAAIAAAAVAAVERLDQVKESLGKQEDRHQH
jgi:hypothetical protein